MLKKYIFLMIFLSLPSVLLAQNTIDQLGQAKADLLRNIEQFEMIQAYQNRLAQAMSQGESTLTDRTLPGGLCLEGMDAICALFPATFGIWGQGGDQ